MELTNHTGLPAVLSRTVIDADDLLAAAVALRVTYDYRSGTLALSEEQTWPAALEPSETPYGMLDGETPFARGGVDVFALGLAHTPAHQLATELDVSFELGRWRHAIRVIGDRAWVRAGDDLHATAPAAFAVMPLAATHAYGGKAAWDGLDVPFADNPEGRGFYLDAAQAEGGRLPNIELHEQYVRLWSDRPEPASTGLHPITSGARLRNGVVGDEVSGGIKRILPTIFNAAHPRMIAPEAVAGMTLQVHGIDADGPWAFALPEAPARLRIAFDDEVIEPALAIDQVGLETEYHRVFITWRHVFRYHVYPRQKRVCELFARAAEVAS